MNKRIDQIKELLKDSPDDEFLNYALALEYEKARELDKALGLLEGLLQKNEKYLGAYYKLGELYEGTGKDELAINTYKKGIELAEEQNDLKTKNELEEALFLIE